MTKDEFILMRMREDTQLYKYLYVVDAAVVVGFIVIFIAMVVTGRIGANIGRIAFCACIVAQLIPMFRRSDAYKEALAELEAAAVDPDVPISESTYQLTQDLVTSSKALWSQVFAYGIIACVMVAGAVVIFLVAADEPALFIFGGILLGMAILLAILAFRAYRASGIAKQFEETN